MQAVKEWADGNVNYDYLRYPVAENNIPSRKIAEFLNGRIEREYEEVSLSGKKLHMLEYRLYKKIKKQ
jgi:[ribosomal protein S5]-alanine N-acetyltransferase